MGYFTEKGQFCRSFSFDIVRAGAAVFIHRENNKRNEIVPVRVRLGNFVSGENKRISLKLATENTVVASSC